MDITSLIQTVEDAIGNLPFPKFDLPPWLLWCTSLRRTGTSKSRAIANILAWMESYGVPTGPNPDGSENLIAGTAAAIATAVMDEICDNGYIQSASSPGTIMFSGTGGNAGGPVEVIGTNTNFFTMEGILR